VDEAELVVPYVSIGLLACTFMLQHSSEITDFLSISPCPTTTEEPYKGDTSGKTFTKFKLYNPISILRSVATRPCVAAAAYYNLNMSFSNGLQEVSYSTEEDTVLPLRATERI
jgi:hypothetical protein